ncbi:MAG: F390 synthetase-related protein [Bacteroidota bacterium]
MMVFKIKIAYYLILFYLNDYRIKPRSVLVHLQQKRFSKLKKKISSSRFYGNIIQKNGSLNDFPVINKKLFMDNFDDINTVSINKEEALQVALQAENDRDFSETIKGITVGLSTGTSGNKGIFLASDNERARWVAAILHRVIGFSWKQRKVAFFLRANSKLYESVNSSLLKFTFFDILNSQEQNIAKLIKLDPDILVGQPSVLSSIADYYKSNNRKSNFTKVISVAEVLEPLEKKYLEQVFKIKIDQVYQCTEGFLATTCQYGNMHFNEDFLIIEKKEIESEGRYSPIITDLYRTSQPIIRYHLDDIIISANKCPCGSIYEAIEQIEGRKDDVIKLNNDEGKLVSIYPDFIRRQIVSTSDSIKSYMVRQVSANRLLISIEPDTKENKIKLQNNLLDNLKSFLARLEISNIEIEFEKPKSPEAGNKLRRIRNEYVNE